MADGILPQFKTCICCKLSKAMLDFNTNRSYRDGYSGKCKQCVREYFFANKARIAELHKEWNERNRQSVNARQAKYRAADREKYREHGRRHYAKDPVPAREAAKAWRENNPERVADGHQRWVANNPAKILEYSRNRRARKRDAEGSHTANDIDRLWDLQRGLCAACRKRMSKYHVDHVVPLAKGGSNNWTNLQLLHPLCNQQKSAKDPIEFMQEQGFLL
jgi:5-methylcytosine-specific restriction endonuclease McrA